MSFYLEEECQVPFTFEYKELAEKVVNACLDYASFPYEAEVNLTLVTNEEIHQINKEYRQIDRPTDVLSFPMLSYEEAGNFTFLEEESDDNFNPDTGEAILGDIIISVDKVKEQAESYGHSQEREFAFLICHSMLHLFGYDHMVDEEAKVMEAKQREILDQLGITR